MGIGGWRAAIRPRRRCPHTAVASPQPWHIAACPTSPTRSHARADTHTHTHARARRRLTVRQPYDAFHSLSLSLSLCSRALARPEVAPSKFHLGCREMNRRCCCLKSRTKPCSPFTASSSLGVCCHAIRPARPATTHPGAWPSATGSRRSAATDRQSHTEPPRERGCSSRARTRGARRERRAAAPPAPRLSAGAARSRPAS